MCIQVSVSIGWEYSFFSRCIGSAPTSTDYPSKISDISGIPKHTVYSKIFAIILFSGKALKYIFFDVKISRLAYDLHITVNDRVL